MTRPDGPQPADLAAPDTAGDAAQSAEGNRPGVTSAGAAGLATLMSAVLAACGGGSDGSTAGSGTSSSGAGDGSGASSPAPAQPASAAEAARFLQQAQFSSTQAEIDSVRSLGYDAWLEAEMNRSTSTTGWDWLVSQGYNSADSGVLYNGSYTDFMVWQQLMSAPDALRKRVALAWSEIMVVSADGIDGENPSFAMAAYWDLLNQHAFGNYRQLLEAITLNPAMGAYLNTRGNQGENPKTGRLPDENYAREVMQLFTIGLYQLNADGTLKRGANGQPIETYGASDVSNLARVFTGYNWDTTGHVKGTNPVKFRNPMAFTAARHSTMDASFLGTTIAGNTPGAQALGTALDTLFNHANTAPFIAHQLIQRLVTSNPSSAYVGRVAAVFANNGSGVRGDLRAVTKAVLLDSEAREAPSLKSATWGRLREPMLRLVQWARTFGATSNDGKWIVWNKSDASTALGQSPLRSPSVFNFFRPGYVPPNTALATSSLTAPEFQLANETSVAGYVNFMQNAIAYGVYGSSTSKVSVDTYTQEMALVNDPPALVDRLNLILAAGQLSAATVAAIRDAINSINPNSDWARKTRVWSAIVMVMCCPEYLVQK